MKMLIRIIVVTFIFSLHLLAAPIGICLHAYSPEAPLDKIACFEFERIERITGGTRFFLPTGKTQIITDYRNRGTVLYPTNATDPSRILEIYETTARQSPATRPYLNPWILKLRNSLAETAKQNEATAKLPSITLPDGTVLRGCRVTRTDLETITVTHTDGIKKLNIAELNNETKKALQIQNAPNDGRTDTATNAPKSISPPVRTFEKVEQPGNSANQASQSPDAPNAIKQTPDKAPTSKPREPTQAVIQDDRKLEELRNDAEQGHADAQLSVGLNYSLGKETVQDYTKAAYWFQKAAAQGNARAQFHLGACYANGQGVPKDYTEAVKWYRMAAERGDGEAQFNLGLCYDSGQGVPVDLPEAITWYRKGADRGNPMAQLFLGACLFFGEGVTQDIVAAAGWYQRAAEQGNPDAQCNLGVLYKKGEGVPRDPSIAVEWYRKAAEQGNPMAQYNLGTCYGTGEGVSEDIETAMVWIEKAANLDFPMAQFQLGLIYDLGYKGIVPDFAQATQWYEKAAAHGYSKAQFRLGLCYASGRGVSRNVSLAYMWFALAADSGTEPNASVGMDYLTQEMDQNQILEAKEMVRAWKPALETSDWSDPLGGGKAKHRISIDDKSASELLSQEGSIGESPFSSLSPPKEKTQKSDTDTPGGSPIHSFSTNWSNWSEPLLVTLLLFLFASIVLASKLQREKKRSPFKSDSQAESSYRATEILIKFHCPTCGAKISAGSDQFGVSTNCPSCDSVFAVPCETATDLRKPLDSPSPHPAPEVPNTPSSPPADPPIETHRSAPDNSVKPAYRIEAINLPEALCISRPNPFVDFPDQITAARELLQKASIKTRIFVADLLNKPDSPHDTCKDFAEPPTASHLPTYDRSIETGKLLSPAFSVQRIVPLVTYCIVFGWISTWFLPERYFINSQLFAISILAVPSLFLAILTGVYFIRPKAFPRRDAVMAFAFTMVMGLIILLVFQRVAAYELHSSFRIKGKLVIFDLILRGVGLAYEWTHSENLFKQFLGFIGGVGLCEELTKLLPLFVLILRTKREIDYRQFLVVGFFSGIGFGTGEALYGYAPWSGNISTDGNILRWFACVPSHAIYTMVDAAFLWFLAPDLKEAKGLYQRLSICALVVLPIAVIHGVYDVLCSLPFIGIVLDLLSILFMYFVVGWVARKTSHDTSVTSSVPSDTGPIGWVALFERDNKLFMKAYSGVGVLIVASLFFSSPKEALNAVLEHQNAQAGYEYPYGEVESIESPRHCQICNGSGTITGHNIGGYDETIRCFVCGGSGYVP